MGPGVLPPIALGWCLLIGRPSATLAQQFFLDLTRPIVAQTEADQSWGCGGGQSVATERGEVRPPGLPLSVRILSLSAKGYHVGDVLTSELLLTNIGTSPFRVPTTVDQGLAFDPHCKWLPKPGTTGLHGSVGLRLADSSGHFVFIGGHSLFGLSDNAATFCELAPGKSMRIKTSGKVILEYTSPIQKSLAAGKVRSVPLTVTAILTMDDTPSFGAYRPVVSANSVGVELMAR